ncbi:MFS transporter, DHA1 family, purine ribonucleoside efflux pump/MFS transporter, DHA1 family, L-arabinose/isopropyl-beta-D-thiogalactopyranoside export protein [Pasteurella multocida]|uniref:Probable sugar efflux transporter n=2 Tax=Pasteurella multocida TaxID=747 RepID=SOTB_PASMU|nr:sugar transporter [Pasteurella multocida]Q9CM87.1 RecName: Full=Probable sugar efflux transporter [Pasteurella multocida subsp. multocida str. Pm70]AAK03033.1 unknown [Pasteurella multocida subsp. multocida str. Pm70]AFI45437.1 AraJ protein [Pasteurella multocida subsp. multocida str. 3480]APW54869.1 sugar efflux transporter [Pasteurella multocida subsp. multocida str. HN07]ARA69398.1 MFS transporter [Pasteurella multocida subsp. multocida]ARA88233.1 MFS transporter [Pasteurella multocida 
MLPFQAARQRQFARVITFALAGFVFNTTEFIPVALLSDIAQSFAMPVSQTGLIITVYAWVVSLMSLPFMLLTAKAERRGLLIKLLVLFILSHLLSVIAWDFWVLVLARIGVALTHSIFWAITASLVIRVAPKDKKSQAIGLLAIGCSLAMILGLPLGRLIGQFFGWRATFAIIALIAIGILCLFYQLLPHLPSKNAGSLNSLPTLFKRPLLLGLYALTMIIISAHFTAYSYIEPFMLNISTMSHSMATFVLFVFGLSGITASLLFNRYYNAGPIRFILFSMGLLTATLLLLFIASQQTWTMFLLTFFWGIGIAGIGLGLQIRVLHLAPDATDVAMAIYSGIYNIGIGAGALLGNQVMQHYGLAYIGVAGALFAVFGLVLFILVQWKYGHLAPNKLSTEEKKKCG